MYKFLCIAMLLFAVGAQAAEVVLPDALPDVAADEEMAEADMVEGKVLPNLIAVPVPAVSASASKTVFEFPEMPEKKLAARPAVHTPEEAWQKDIRASLVAKGAGEQIVLDGVRYGHNVGKAKQDPAHWYVQDVAFDGRSSRFSGKLVAFNEEVVSFTGRYSAMQSVPVLKNKLKQGAVIAASDIEIIPVPTSRLRVGNTITDPQRLIGKTLRRLVATGTPLHSYDLVLPTVVMQNSEVEMVYSNNGIEISDRGIAVEKGAMGDVIRVKNSKSGTMIRARVDGPNKVLVNYFTEPKVEHYATN